VSSIKIMTSVLGL